MNTFTRKATARLAGLAVLLFALPLTFAGLSPKPGSDDVTTSPIVADSTGPGFVLDVEFSELEAVLQSIRGTGVVDVEPGLPGRFTVTLSGNYRIRISRAAVRSGDVGIEYVGRRGGARILQRRGDLLLIQR